MHKVFVYGTLLEGFGNYAWSIGPAVESGEARALGRAVTDGPMTLGDVGPFPALVSADGGPGPVHGEVYEVNDHLLRRLDQLEGCPRMYRRIEIDVLVDGDPVTVWTYLWADKSLNLPVIPTGSWREHKSRAGYASALSRVLSAADGDNRDPRYETLMNMIVEAAELANDLNESSVEDALWNLAEVLA